MAHEIVIRRRRIGEKDLELIRQLIVEEGLRGRTYISRRLCQIWDWRQANGRFREIACRDVLRQLDAKKLIKLPAMMGPARRPGYKNAVRAPERLDQPPAESLQNDWRDRMQLTLVRGQHERRMFNGLIGTYHYLGYQQPTGAQLKYLAFYGDQTVACLSFGPAAFKVAARDRFIGWPARAREERLSWLVNNDRFLILPWIKVPELASWLLSGCLRRLRKDWQLVYRHDLALCETFVEQDRFAGRCYAAANWMCVGQTQGRGRNDRLQQAGLPIKTIWLYALRADFRRLLCASEP